MTFYGPLAHIYSQSRISIINLQYQSNPQSYGLDHDNVDQDVMNNVVSLGLQIHPTITLPQENILSLDFNQSQELSESTTASQKHFKNLNKLENDDQFFSSVNTDSIQGQEIQFQSSYIDSDDTTDIKKDQKLINKQQKKQIFKVESQRKPPMSEEKKQEPGVKPKLARKGAKERRKFNSKQRNLLLKEYRLNPTIGYDVPRQRKIAQQINRLNSTQKQKEQPYKAREIFKWFNQMNQRTE